MKLTKLIPVSAMALSLVVLTSCRIENLAPDLEPYFKEITGTDSTSFMSALASVSSPEGNTADFKDGFKAGYAAGYTEGAKLNKVAVAPTPASAPLTVASSTPASAPLTVASSAPASASIPSWGYTSTSAAATTSEPDSPPSYSKPSTPQSSSSSRYSRTYRSSSRGCAGGS